MADGPSVQVNIKFEADLFQLVEDYRRKLTPIPTRSEAVKALVRRGLRCTEPPP